MNSKLSNAIKQAEEMKSIDWVKRNETMIDFTMTQEEWEAQDVECLSDTDEEEDEWTDPLDKEDAWRLENPMECFNCGDKGNAIAKKVEGKWKINCVDCWSKEEEDESGFGTAYHDGSGFDDCDPEGKGNRLCSEYPKDKWCSECVYLHGGEENPEPPITEDWFRTNGECVCEKKPDNDYPCLCDEVEEE